MTARTSPSRHERFLQWLGVDRDMVEAVCGDIAEDFADRCEHYGPLVARIYHAGDIVRSIPHFVSSAYRRGDARTRRRIVALISATAAMATLGASAIVLLTAGPARLVASVADPVDGVVINSARPTRLPIYVFDRFGRKLGGSGVTYQWIGGESVTISPDGSATCVRNADAVVRAVVGDLKTDVAVRCRPVEAIEASSWVDLIAGDSPKQLPFIAYDADHRMVTLLRGMVDVADSAIVQLHGTTIRAVAPGRTTVGLDIGDHRVKMAVIVHRIVQSFTDGTSDSRYMAIPVMLARHDTKRIALPSQAAFWLKYIPTSEQSPPTIWLDGRAACSSSDGIRSYRVPKDEVGLYCTTDGPAAMVLEHGETGPAFAAGHVALERLDFK
jgi:hypothetical protein